MQFEVPCKHPTTGKEYLRLSRGTCITAAYDNSVRGEEVCLVADLGLGAGAVRRLRSASELVGLLRGGKVLAIPEGDDPTPASERAVGLSWHNGQPSGVMLGRATDLNHLNPSMGYRHTSVLRFLDGTLEYGVGRAVVSHLSGPGWCGGILTATKVSKVTKVFVCIWGKEKQLHFVPVPHVQLTTGPQLQANREQLDHLAAAMDKLERLLNAGSYFSNSQRAQPPLLPAPLAGRRKRVVVVGAAGATAEDADPPPPRASRPRRASGGGREEEPADDCASVVSMEVGTEDGEAGLSELTVQQLRDRLARVGATAPRSARKADLVQLLEAQETEAGSEDGCIGIGARAGAGRRAGATQMADNSANSRRAAGELDVAQQLKALREQVEAQTKREAELVQRHKMQAQAYEQLVKEQKQQRKQERDAEQVRQRMEQEEERRARRGGAEASDTRAGARDRTVVGKGFDGRGEESDEEESGLNMHLHHHFNKGKGRTQRPPPPPPPHGRVQVELDLDGSPMRGGGGLVERSGAKLFGVDEQSTLRARVQFVRQALGLEAGVAVREVARVARRKLRGVRLEVDTLSVSGILLEAEQYFKELQEVEGDLLTPSPQETFRPKAYRGRRGRGRGPRELAEVYPVGEEPFNPPPPPQWEHNGSTSAPSHIHVYAGMAGVGTGNTSHGQGGSSSVDAMEAMLLMQQADLDARSAHRVALLLAAQNRK